MIVPLYYPIIQGKRVSATARVGIIDIDPKGLNAVDSNSTPAIGSVPSLSTRSATMSYVSSNSDGRDSRVASKARSLP